MTTPTKLYPRNNRTKSLDTELFRAPSSEYRGAPFWCWNNKLSWKQLEPQIDHFKTMGMGGFHIHVRTGLVTPYLGEEYMSLVKASTEKAASNGMLAWLYDEDRWPSGFAGGLVTKDEKFRAKHLLFTCSPYGHEASAAVNNSGAFGSRNGNGRLIGTYEVILKDGVLADYKFLREGEKGSGRGVLWYAYLETAKPVAWFNHQTYVDTLNPAATRRFIEVTHEAYAKAVGNHFGKTIRAIFTDEPQFPHKTCFQSTTDQRDLFLPFTEDLLDTFAETHGQQLEKHLPELFWEQPGRKASVARYRYHDHVGERFATAYADVLGKWCEDHGIALTGHMMSEQTLESQAGALGDAMRSYRAFQLPGIDMLCDAREYNTAKQAQSAVHQYGRDGMLSELYGVTGWDFDFTGHKGQGDWQAALGVTIRNHHLTWVSMAGEAKRDYPASIGYQSPWFDQYRLVEDHFARVNTALTRGKPLVRIGVIHPIESYWLCCGPLEQTSLERKEREKQFSDLTQWLLFGLLDFNFICESLLSSQSAARQTDKFQVGEMAYDAVIVPALRTIRSSTLERLQSFAKAGGAVIFTGEIPSLVDALPSEAPAQLAAQCRHANHTQTGILQALEPFRELEARLHDARPSDSLLCQTRQDKDSRYLFICNTDRVKERKGVTLKVRGDWSVTHLDTLTGAVETLAAESRDGWTVLRWNFPGCGSLLLQLEPGSSPGGKPYDFAKFEEVARLTDPVPVTLSEPNVLLLDQAQWRINEGTWKPVEEMLRLDNLIRREFGLPDRCGNIPQPWADKEPSPTLGQVELRFRIESAISVDAPLLALEEAAKMKIILDGKPVPSQATGWWVDEAIQTVALPRLDAGAHELVLSLPFNRKTDLENIYLLGDFGVRVFGRHAELIAPVRQLAFGDWTQQGLPFYAGNVTYHCQIKKMSGPLRMQAPQFKNPLLTVALDNKPLGQVAFPPFEIDLGSLTPGIHALDLTAYGNRYNSFAAVHNCDPFLEWKGPDSYRSEGINWSYEYQFKPMGILCAPLLKASKK
ncbi:MAG: hypothetical protein PHD76_12800 [Methylacidiphilales bacterium]|nr:hypothetical protein [Candidatus Methylacidiphilales bacterium]